jgi:hypothetical protein
MPILGAVKCPHCQTTFTESWGYYQLGIDSDGGWWVAEARCDAEQCRKIIARLIRSGPGATIPSEEGRLIRPRSPTRPIPAEVPDRYRRDYEEAALTLPDSSNASAALSRRCLQSLFRNETNIKKPRQATRYRSYSTRTPCRLGSPITSMLYGSSATSLPTKRRTSARAS